MTAFFCIIYILLLLHSLQFIIFNFSQIDQFWIKAKIQKETNGDVIAETLKGMKYLDAFVKEILRYHPPVQMFRRSCSREVELCGYKIPSSTVVCYM